VGRALSDSPMYSW